MMPTTSLISSDQVLTFTFPIIGLNHPGRTAAELATLQIAALNHAQRRHRNDADDLGCGLECDLTTLGPFAGSIDGDLMVITERAHANFGPTIAAPGRLADAIEEACDLLVGHQPGEIVYQRQRILRRCIAMLAGRAHLELQRRVITALPMQHHHDEPVVDARDNLL